MFITAKTPVVLPENPSAPEKTAAKELAAYLSAVCGETAGGENARIVLRENASLANEQLSVKVEDNTLYLEGGGRGVLYAVYRFLEEIGCRFYASDTEVVPRLDGVTLNDALHICEVSPFEYRDLYWTDTYDTAFAVKRRINGAKVHLDHHRLLPEEWGGGIGYVGPSFVHTFSHFVPAKEYFDTHTESLDLINGERNGTYLYSQLCLSNPDVLRLVTEGVRSWLRENKGARIVSVSQDDSYVYHSYCTCPACAAVDEEEGAPSGSLIRFVNKVAEAIEEEFPDVAIDTLAYQYSVVPPKYTRPRHNVMVRLCTGGCFGHPIDTCPNNAPFKASLQRWAEMCDRLYIWDYTTNFAQYLNPYPNLRTHQSNAQLFAATNVRGVFEQGNYQEGKSGEFGELRSYILASVLWNPDAPVDTDGFMDAYYGGGAPYVQKYVDFLHDRLGERHFNWLGSASELWKGYITEDDLPMLDALWTEAYKAALAGGTTAGGFGIPAELAAEHVERSGLCHRWLKLDCRMGEFADPDTFAQTEERFLSDCRRLGVMRLSEGVNIPSPQVQ